MENKIYWNKEKNIPVIIDPIRDSARIQKGFLYEISTDLRPVFLEEKHLLIKLFHWKEELYFSSIWCNKNGRYIVDGIKKNDSMNEAIKKVENIEKIREEILSFFPTDEMLKREKEIFNEFVEENREHMYSLLENKERDEEGEYIGAYNFIEEVIEKYKNRIPMVSFSGGKDSTVVSHLVRKALNNQSILHIFGDTTLELPDTYRYIDEFKKSNPAVPFLEERNEENNFFEMCKEIDQVELSLGVAQFLKQDLWGQLYQILNKIF